MKVVVLCGGRGSRLPEETEVRPKPMVEIGGKPILWYIMKAYAFYGYRDFILCLGYKGQVIKQYFSNYELLNNDFTIDLSSRCIEVHRCDDESGWRVTLADTGLNSMTGARVKRVQRYVGSNPFMLTYGDGLTDMNINRLVEFHRSHGKIGTVTAVSPPSRYGELIIKGNQVKAFHEKPEVREGFISGGYFVFNGEFFDYLQDDDECVLEREPLERLSADGQLMVYSHLGFWQCMDTPRDLQLLQEICQTGNPPWKV